MNLKITKYFASSHLLGRMFKLIEPAKTQGLVKVKNTFELLFLKLKV